MSAMQEHGLGPDVRVRQSTRTAARTVQQRAVVVVIDTQRLHRLNPTGATVWNLCDGRPLGEVVDEFAERYGLERDVAERDVAAFVRELVSVGAVELEGSA